MPKISVIVPVYKAEPFLRKCVDSILRQTEADLEVILVDDGSPDGCGAICDEYAAKDRRVKAIHQENRGVSAARNAGLAAAAGEYLAFVDADDYLDEQMYARMLAAAEQTRADVVECGWRVAGLEDPGTGQQFLRTGLQALESLLLRQEQPDSFFVCPFNKLIRAEAARELRFLEGCAVAEDALYAVMLMSRVKTAVKLDVGLYHYYLSEGSAMRSGYSLRRCDEVLAYSKMAETVAALGQPRLDRIIRQKYLMRIVMHWMECRSRKASPEFARQAKLLHRRFRQDYPALKNSISKKEQLKFRLFLGCPGLFYPVFAAYLKRKGYTRYAY